MMRLTSVVVVVTVLFIIACGVSCDSDATNTITHTFNLASHMPAHLAVMFSMSWFGIPASDPQGGGLDAGWGNWKWGGGNIPTNDPTTCNEGTAFSLAFGAEERYIASKRRPLAGIYSSSARNAEGLARVDLMLSSIRRSCDGGANARLDAWAVQLSSVQFTSKYGKTSCASCDLAYRALIAFYTEAKKGNMVGAIIPAIDATWIFNPKFAASVGLSCPSTNRAPCIAALTKDITDMATIALSYGSITRKINGLPVLVIYFDGTLTVAQWKTILQNARNAAGTDFYVISSAPGTVPTYWGAFDAISPWTGANYGLTNPTYAQAYSWAQGKHATYVSAIKNYPGCVVMGSVTPGFDDYTMNWGTDKARVMARNTLYIQAATDYFKATKIVGTFMATWDDWTEGTHFEPDTNSGTAMLVALKQGLGKMAGEAADPTGDKALDTRWTTYGRARNCNKGTASTPPTITLLCPATAGTGEGGEGSSSEEINNGDLGYNTTGVFITNITDSWDSSDQDNHYLVGSSEDGGVSTADNVQLKNYMMILSLVVAAVFVFAL